MWDRSIAKDSHKGKKQQTVSSTALVEPVKKKIFYSTMTSGYSNMKDDIVGGVAESQSGYVYSTINNTSKVRKAKKGNPAVYTALKQSDIQLQEYSKTQNLQATPGHEQSSQSKSQKKSIMMPTSSICIILVACSIVLCIWLGVSLLQISEVFVLKNELQTTGEALKEDIKKLQGLLLNNNEERPNIRIGSSKRCWELKNMLDQHNRTLAAYYNKVEKVLNNNNNN